MWAEIGVLSYCRDINDFCVSRPLEFPNPSTSEACHSCNRLQGFIFLFFLNFFNNFLISNSFNIYFGYAFFLQKVILWLCFVIMSVSVIFHQGFPLLSLVLGTIRTLKYQIGIVGAIRTSRVCSSWDLSSCLIIIS